jgi:D-arabinose 1-dehydrogenase-like Zn-dependent alcohol dehydrogenase
MARSTNPRPQRASSRATKSRSKSPPPASAEQTCTIVTVSTSLTPPTTFSSYGDVTGGCVLGHEGVGIIEATGPDVKYMKKGDRVGWGYVHDTCGHCEMCLTGREQYCLERQMYGEANLDQGSFAHKAVWKESFLFPIPDGLSDEAAAPLQCGGATVFNALFSNGIKPTETVGIMGVGGLGKPWIAVWQIASIS